MIGATLDPQHVVISNHALLRYMERRGTSDRRHAERALRGLLARVAHQCPPIIVRTGHTPSRRFRCGGIDVVVSADCQTVITLYHNADVTGRARQARRRGRR